MKILRCCVSSSQECLKQFADDKTMSLLVEEEKLLKELQ